MAYAILMPNSTTLDDLLKLPPAERLALAEALWSSLAADDAVVPVPDWHVERLADRIADDDTDPDAAQDVDTLMRGLRP
jgi:putative addiction module component (TIGR02574 family)